MSGQQQLDLLTKKIIAYFHDPPWKAWAITRRLRSFENIIPDENDKKEYLECKKSSRTHECQALYLLKKLGVEVPGHGSNYGQKREIPRCIKAADVLAATIDRWITTDIPKENSVVGYFDKMNVFRPDLVYDSDKTESKENKKESRIKRVEKYICKLAKIIQGQGLSECNEKNKGSNDTGTGAQTADEALKYHLIYFFAPLLWYEVFPGVPPVADTRVPTHTIFDHATATAAMLNILDCDDNNRLRFKGYLAVIEIPSIQEFISLSRKARDLWASSWLTSALLWKAVEGFVEKYGPDVVLRPELSLNHFFIAWLYNKVSNENTKKAIKELAAKYAYMDWNPTVAMMTEKVFLILPETAGKDESDVEGKLRESFYNGWKIIAREILPQIDFMSKDKKLVSYVLKAIDFPPIEPVINVIDVAKKFEEFSEKLGLTNGTNVDYIRCPHSKRNGRNLTVYDSLFFEYLFNEVKKYKRPKRVYGSLLSDVIYEVTKDGNYRLCTVCGLLPSVYNYYTNGKEEIRAEDESESTQVKPDDRLCPYCAVKRMLKGEKVLNVMEKLGLKVYDWEKEDQKGGNKEKEKQEQATWRFPSTSELAMADYAYHLVVKDGESGKCMRLLDYLNAAFKGKKNENKNEEDLSEKACGCYSGNPGACEAFTSEERKLIKEYGNLYYAIIKGDADFMERGYWSRNLKEATIFDYIQQVVRSLEEGQRNKNLKNVQSLTEKLNESADKIREKLVKAREKLYGKSNGKSLEWIPLTMSYVYTLSRALTVQAVLDKKILEENCAVPIYLGGDDILALAPLKVGDRYPAIEAVLKSRESYWKYSDKGSYDGFKVMNGMVVDSLRVYGRSFAVFVAHYKDPMSLSISVTKWLLEQKYRVHGKDVLLVSSGRGASGFIVSAMKLSGGSTDAGIDNLDTTQVELVLELLKSMESGKVSNNLIYDVQTILDYSKEEKVASSDVYSNLVFRLVKRNATGEQIPSEIEERLRKVVGKLFKCTNDNDNKGVCETREAFINVILAVSHLR